jgi:hypothetical protein
MAFYNYDDAHRKIKALGPRVGAPCDEKLEHATARINSGIDVAIFVSDGGRKDTGLDLIAIVDPSRYKKSPMPRY